MKLGLILESGPEGADIQVLTYLARQIVSKIQIDAVTFRNKPDLVANCGAAVQELLADRCKLVLIVWDLIPTFRDKSIKPDCVQDCRDILGSITKAGVSVDRRIAMICIREELEAWLVTDGRALSQVLSRPTRKVEVEGIKRPDSMRNPKKALRKLFREKGHGDYTDRIHAIRIVRAMPDHTQICKSQSFRRLTDVLGFVSKLIFARRRFSGTLRRAQFSRQGGRTHGSAVAYGRRMGIDCGFVSGTGGNWAAAA